MSIVRTQLIQQDSRDDIATISMIFSESTGQNYYEQHTARTRMNDTALT